MAPKKCIAFKPLIILLTNNSGLFEQIANVKFIFFNFSKVSNTFS